MKPTTNTYSKEVLEHFSNPRNMGEIKDADAVGELGNPSCLLPEEKIFLNDVYDSISKSKKGYFVVSHDSLKNKIIGRSSRKYNGKIITLKNCLGKITLTPEHLVYAIKLPKHYDFLRNKRKREIIPSWYHVENLEKGDIVLYPKLNEVKDLDFLDINISKLKWDFRSPNIPKKIPLEKDLLRLFGYFIAEGNIQEKPSKTYISFALHIKEKNIVRDIRQICKKLFNLDIKVHEKPKNNGVVVYLYSAHVARWFKQLFGNGAGSKKLPEFMMGLPLEKQKVLIYSLWKGDGYCNLTRDGARAGYATISYQLAQQIKVLLIRQGIIPSIYEDKERNSKWAHHKKSYRIHVGQRDSLQKLCSILGVVYHPKSYTSIRSWEDNNFVYLPITNVEKRDYSGIVHNLEVEKAHSFISEAFTLHNCGDVMKIYLKIEKPKDARAGVSPVGQNKIKDIKFQTMGCAAAIATSSMITELAKGKTLDEAEKITNADVASSLKGLPPIKMHCSNLAADVLKIAIKNYKKKLVL